MTTTVETFGIFIMIAIVIELMVGVLKNKLPAPVVKILNPNILSIIFGITIALAFGQNVFAELGVSTNVPFIAEIFTGILLAGGAQLWHELINRLRGQTA